MSREMVLNFGGMSIHMSFESYGSSKFMLLRVFRGFRGSFMEVPRVLEMMEGPRDFQEISGSILKASGESLCLLCPQITSYGRFMYYLQLVLKIIN